MSKIDDPARLNAVLAILPPADALWLAQHLEPLCQVARRRREARAEALHAAWPVLAPDQLVTPAAKIIARDLGCYLVSAWREQQHHAELPAAAFERHRVLHCVAVLSGGRALGWRTVFDALRT